MNGSLSSNSFFSDGAVMLIIVVTIESNNKSNLSLLRCRSCQIRILFWAESRRVDCGVHLLSSKQEGKFQVGESLYIISTNKI